MNKNLMEEGERGRQKVSDLLLVLFINHLGVVLHQWPVVIKCHYLLYTCCITELLNQ